MTTKVMKTTVFLNPIILFSTNILGNDNAGPARSKARAGPCPMPDPIRP